MAKPKTDPEQPRKLTVKAGVAFLLKIQIVAIILSGLLRAVVEGLKTTHDELVALVKSDSDTEE